MLTNALFAFLHFISVLGIAATLFYEWLTFSRTPSYIEARRLQLCDRWYGIFAGLVLAVGFLRVYYFEKGAAFYFASPFFRVKLNLFLLIGLLSIYPTVKFIKWRKQTREGLPPIVSEQDFSRISLVLKIEMVLLAAMVLSASLMAKGIGI